MNPEIKEQCYLLSLTNLSQKEIAQKLNLSEATVSRAINSVTASHDYQLAMKTVAHFLEDYLRADDFFKMQIAELERKKEQDPENYYRIMDMQKARVESIVQLVGQGRVVMALKALKDGKLQLQPDRK